MTTPVSPRPGYPDQPPVHPPGWFGDPWRVSAWRWWDGYQWTPYTWPPAGPADDARTGTRFSSSAFWPSIGWLLLSIFAMIVVTVPAAIVVFALDGSDDTMYVAAICVSYPVLFGAMWWTSRRLSRVHGTGDMRRDFGWRTFHRSDIGWGLLAAFTALVAQGVIGSILRPDDESYRDAVFGGDRPSVTLLVAMGIATIIGAPIFEELLFRGPVMRSLLDRFGVNVALLLQGVVFSLYHVVPSPGLIELSYLTPLFAVGVIFGFAAQRTGRLATAQVAHAAMNAVAYLALVVTVT